MTVACSRRRAASTACCSTRTRSCSPARCRRCSARSGRIRRLPWPARSSLHQKVARSRAPGGCPASRPRWPAPFSSIGASRWRARARAPGPWAGCSRAPCSSAVRQRSRSAGSTPTSTSTPTKPTSASDSGTRDGRSSSSRPQGRSTTTRWRRTPAERSGESSSTTAAAIATCESTSAKCKRSCCGHCSPGPTCCGRPPPWSSPATRPGATGCMPARRCCRAVARGSVRPRRPTTGG